MPFRQEAIIWTNDGQVYWRICMLLSLDKLNSFLTISIVTFSVYLALWKCLINTGITQNASLPVLYIRWWLYRSENCVSTDTKIKPHSSHWYTIVTLCNHLNSSRYWSLICFAKHKLWIHWCIKTSWCIFCTDMYWDLIGSYHLFSFSPKAQGIYIFVLIIN